MLITQDYLDQQRKLHEARSDYGVASVSFAPAVAQVINATRATSVLDYGAGKGRLAHALIPHLASDLDISMQLYDPAVIEFAKLPDPAELVVCIDVLEHIEPECLDDVLQHIFNLTQKFAFITVHTGPAAKTLEDGRNAHLIQQAPKWWLLKLIHWFDPLEFRLVPGGCMMVLKPGKLVEKSRIIKV